MTRRQAKLAARAAERAALEKDPRPYGGFAAEADLVALQEFVPSAVATPTVKGFDRPVKLVTVLPGAIAAMVREAIGDQPETVFVALQAQHRGPNPNRDLAFALQWAKNAPAGATLSTGIADGSQPSLDELLDKDSPLDISVENSFDWWVADPQAIDPAMARSIKELSETIMPSERVDADVDGAVWWTDAGDKAFIRWVRQEPEEKLLKALARLHAAGELNLGPDTKFAGAFRTHGLAVPVFDLDPTVPAAEFAGPVTALNEKIASALANEENLTAAERKSLETIRSRQKTI